MPMLYLNTYEPLVATPRGRAACQARALAPFLDGSIRREPDLEHRFPSISCLCRGGMFAPRLRPDDVVVYMTKKGRWGGVARHWRMTAVLRVKHLFDSHLDAADWYGRRGLALPSNCMVRGNPPRPFAESHRLCGRGCGNSRRAACNWDARYAVRASRHGRFVVCRGLWKDLTWDAPQVHDEDLRAVFGRIPGTRNPGALPITSLRPLLRRLRIPVPLSSP